MKPGDLVTTIPIPNNGGKCYRLFDLLKSEENVTATPPSWPRLVDKLWHGEVAPVISVVEDCDGHLKAKVLSPRGKIGWLRADLIRVVAE